MRGIALSFSTCILALAAASCGPSGVAAKAAKPPELEVKGQAKCGVTKSHETPLVIEWPDDARVRLERAAAGKPVAVRYEGCEMRLLRGCTVKAGAYRYAPVTPKHSQVAIRNEDELFAKLPAGAVGLEGKLKQAGQLTVDMLMVGRFEADRQQFDRSELEGACEGATHVVAGLTVGAFHFYAGANASASGGVDAIVASGRASTAAGRETLNQDGNAQACEKSAASDTTPPYGCSAPMVVEVAKINEPRAVAPAPAPLPAGAEPAPYGQTEPPDGRPPPYGAQPPSARRPAGAPNPYATQSYGGTSSPSPFGLTPMRAAAAGGAAVGLLAAIYAGSAAAGKRREIESACNEASKSCSQEGLDAIKSYKTLAWVANAGLGLFAISGVTYLLLPNRHGDTSPTVGVVKTPGGAALQLAGAF